MKIKSTTLAVMAIFGLAAVSSHAAVIFSQDFSANNTLATYISATPNSGQLNAIGTSGSGVTVGVSSGVLAYARTTTNVGSFSRSTDFSPAPNGISYKFDLTVSGNSTAQTTAAVFQVGSGFGNTNIAEANAVTYARFGINFTATDGALQIRDISTSANSGNFAGTQTVFWVLNNTGSSFSYMNPSAGQTTIANDTADLWLGTTKVLNGVAVLTPALSITDLKFAFTAGTGTISIDNIVIDAIPEPRAALLGAFGTLVLLRRRRR